MRSCLSGSPIRLVAILALALLSTGCGSGSFIGTRYDNFTAYYNTFYNARRSYRAGVDNRQRNDEKVDRNQYIGVFIEAGRPAGGARDFDEAVLKSADVLREHGDSKWVDDALLLIGKSYFYQNNYVGAQQKFEEAITLQSGLEEEAEFWLARTLVASGDYGGAVTVIAEALAGEFRDKRWESALRLVQGELHVKQGDFESAASELAAGLKSVEDKEIGAKAQFLLGQVLEKLERYPEAVEAYRATRRFRPRYELDYAAQVSAIRVEGRHVDPNAALKRLRRMERDDKHFATRFELAVLRGQILQSMGLADEAFNVYDELLYDPDKAQQVGQLRGKIHYALAELYRDLDQDYVLAAAHFDTAASVLRAPTAGARGVASTTTVDPTTLAPEAIVDAQDLKESFDIYAKAFAEADRLDSLLWLGRMDDSTFAAKVLDIRRQRAEELAERQRRQAAREIARAFQQAASSPIAGGNRGLPEGKVIPNYNGAGGGRVSFLSHDDPVMRQEGLVSFARKWGDRPLVPNWRRLDAVSGLDEATIEAAQEAEEETVIADDQLPEVDTSDVPRDSLAQAEMQIAQARARYDVGTALFLGIQRPDSAAVWYRMVIEETPDEPVARRALFALAEVQRALGDSSSANGIYQRIVAEYPDSEFATRIRNLLGMEAPATAPDSLQQAEAAYKDSFEAWQDQDYRPAMNGLLRTAGRFAGTAVEPKALLAAGSVFMEWANRDSLDIFEPMPIEVEDSLLVRTGLISPPVLELPADSTASALAADSLNADLAAEAPSGRAAPDSLTGAREAGVPTGGAAPDSPGGRNVTRPPVQAVATDSLGAVVADSLARGGAAPGPPPGAKPDSVEVRTSGAAGDEMAAGSAPAVGSSAPAAGSSAATAGASTTAAGVPIQAGEAATTPAEPERPWNEVRLEMLLRHVSKAYPGTAYATSAASILKGVEDILAEKKARQDSVLQVIQQAREDSLAAIAAASDSLEALKAAGMPADSLVAGTKAGVLQAPVEGPGEARAAPDSVLAGQQVGRPPTDRAADRDSLAGVPTFEQVGEAVTGGEAGRADSVNVDSIASALKGADSINADSIASALKRAVSDSASVATADPLVPPKRPAPEQDVPAAVPADTARAARNLPIGMAGARNAAQDLNQDLEVVQSSELSALRLGEEDDGSWSGWTLVLSALRDLGPAETVQENYQRLFGEFAQPEIWVGKWKREEGVLVTLGRFESQEEVQALADLLGARRPPDAWILHITP